MERSQVFDLFGELQLHGTWLEASCQGLADEDVPQSRKEQSVGRGSRANTTSASEDHQRGATEQAHRQVLSGNRPDNAPGGVTKDGCRGSPFGMDLEDIFSRPSVLRANDLKAGVAQDR